MEIEATADGLRLRKLGTEPSLIRKKGILVHHGSVPVSLDVAEFIRAERTARIRRTTPNVWPTRSPGATPTTALADSYDTLRAAFRYSPVRGQTLRNRLTDLPKLVEKGRDTDQHPRSQHEGNQ